MTGVVISLCAFACWTALLYKTRDLRKNGREPGLVALCVTFTFLAFAFTAQIPSVAATIDALSGIPNLGALCIHISSVACSASAQVFLLLWECPPEQAWRKIRLRLPIFGCVLIIMVILFKIADIKHRDPHFLMQNAGMPLIAVYLLFYEMALAAGIAATGKMSLRYAKIAGRPWLRRGLRIAAVGAALELAYCATRVATVVSALLGQNPNALEVPAVLLSGSGCFLLVVGLTIPGWGPQLSALRAWIDQYHSHQALYPLWAALHRELGMMTIDPPRSPLADRLTLRDLNFRIHRRVIEIRDGQLRLSPWAEPDVNAVASELYRSRGLDGGQLAAAVEAAKLMAALQAKSAGKMVQQPAQARDPVRGGDDLAHETEWLILVARAFGRLQPQ